MIKLKLDKLSDKFENTKHEMDVIREKVCYLDYSCTKNGYSHIDVRDSVMICLAQLFYTKEEFYTALKDFLILRKIMEKNNGK